MTDDDDKISRLVANLVSQTKYGNIGWGETDDDDAYLYTGSSASVIIEHDRSGVFTLRVLNTSGKVVTEVIRDDADPWNDELGKHLKELHHLARREALQVDQTVDGILQELEGMPPF